MFEIKTKEIPYFEFVKQKDLGVFEYQSKANPSNISNAYLSLSG